MRLPLVLGANPRTSNPDAMSVILPGRWRIVSKDVKDSIVRCKSPSLELSVGDEFEIKVHTAFMTNFIHRGTEHVVSVFAEKI